MKRKCEICKNRPAQNNEWNTPEEKRLCFTCRTFLDMYRATYKALYRWSLEKNVVIDDVIAWEKRNNP
jgi:late competence protein required for DNA uptake (superfamily II DNA/RNA helicase)